MRLADRNGDRKVWLTTAYQMGAEAGTRTDTASNGSEGDTARPGPGATQRVLAISDGYGPVMFTGQRYEKDKGRKWLKDSAGSNSQQPQAKLALDGIMVPRWDHGT